MNVTGWMSSGGAIDPSIGWMVAGGNAQNLALGPGDRSSVGAAIGELSVELNRFAESGGMGGCVPVSMRGPVARCR
jgi:hypothetical protein